MLNYVYLNLSESEEVGVTVNSVKMGKTISDLPNEMLLKIFSMCSVEDLVLTMQHVNKRWYELVRDTRMWKYLSYFPKRSIPAGDVIEVLANAPLLRSLVLCEHVHELLVDVICACCPLMESLEFYDIHTVTTDMLEKIYRYLPKLQNLTLRSMDIESHKFAAVLGKFHNLKKLSLLHTFYMGTDLLKCIADGCESLEYLRLDGIDVSDEMVQYFVKMKGPQLTSLLLDGFRLSSASLRQIKECSKLQVFMFHDCSSLTERIFLDIVSLPKLRSLQLPEARQISAITLAIGLCQISLSELTELDLSKSFLDDEGVKCLTENCQKLKFLNLAMCLCLTDFSMQYIASCIKLQHLNIKNCCFTDAGMKYLPELHQLKYLNISRNNISDHGMKYVMKCSQLTGLQINYCGVSPASINMVLSCLKLARFSCVGCRTFCGDKEYLSNLDRNCFPVL